MRYLLVIAATLALAACVRMVPDMRPETPAALPPGTVSSAAFAPVTRGVDVNQLGLGDDDAGTALVSFLESCPAILKRDDQSGLTFPEDWRPACEAASTWPVSDARRFFASFFENFLTYEPIQIKKLLKRQLSPIYLLRGIRHGF